MVKLITAEWYIPWSYTLEDRRNGCQLTIRNGAGQQQARFTIPTREGAEAYALDHQIKRAEEFGALIRIVE